MGILVADGAESAVVVAAAQFLYGTIGVNQVCTLSVADGTWLTVMTSVAVLQMFAEPPLVWPDGILAASEASVAAAFAGKDDEQLVDVSVLVPVVDAPIDVAVF